jgi:hypothetical protein
VSVVTSVYNGEPNFDRRVYVWMPPPLKRVVGGRVRPRERDT